MRDVARREDIRDILLDAVDRLLARYGYRKMTMDDLAREVGIGKGTLYLHFPSKEAITLAHVDRIVGRVTDRLRAIAREDGPAADRVRRMLVARVLVRFDGVQHYSQSLNDLLSALRPGLLARREHHFEEEARVLADVLAEGTRLGSFAVDDPVEAARALLLATNALLPYSLSARELGERADVERRAARVADLLLVGLLRRDAPRGDHDRPKSKHRRNPA